MSLVGFILLLLAIDSVAPRAAAARDLPPSGAPIGSPGAGNDATPAGEAATDAPGLDLPPPGAPGAQAPSPPEPASPAPPPSWSPTPRRYGDRGTPEIALGFGYGSSTGLLAAGGFRYFVVDTLAPGIEGTYVSGGAGGTAYGLALGALRFVPFRTTSMALVATARGGRMFIAHHDDGWAVGGGLGVLLMMSPSVGLEIGYEALRLLPSSFCVDLSACTLSGITIGVRIVP